MTIAEAIGPGLDEARNIHLNALQRLELGARSDSIVLQFDFPEGTRAAAEQYLLYFAEFLRDVGVEAEAEVRERAGIVLFAVKPTSGREALAQVSEALALYLSLPSAGLREIGTEAEIAIDKLVANIHHLQGQLRMAAAVMKAQQTTMQRRR